MFLIMNIQHLLVNQQLCLQLVKGTDGSSVSMLHPMIGGVFLSDIVTGCILRLVSLKRCFSWHGTVTIQSSARFSYAKILAQDDTAIFIISWRTGQFSVSPV